MLISSRVFWRLAETDRITYGNETNIVNQDSAIDSYLDKPHDQNFNQKPHAGCLYSAILEPRVQSIHFQEYFTSVWRSTMYGGVRISVSQPVEQNLFQEWRKLKGILVASPPASRCSKAGWHFPLVN